MRNFRSNALLLSSLLAVACGGPVSDTTDATGSASSDLKGPSAAVHRGEELFEHATFGGNKRTCATCHSDQTGTISPRDVLRRNRINRRDPLFASIDSDDGVGDSFTRLLTDATIRVGIPLPENVSIIGSDARTAVFARGVPTTIDSPALDPVLMLDGREPTLESQAASAIRSHFQPRNQPTAGQLSDIAAYERTLFSSRKTERYFKEGTEPTMPEGTTESEKRGRAFFMPGGGCAGCHGGPMLNTIDDSGNFGPPGARFSDIGVSEVNIAGRPTNLFNIAMGDENFQIEITDPGRFLITGDPADMGAFKIPSLWNIRHTAPYFHDNSAKDLKEVAAFYALVFGQFGQIITEQDQADMVAYMNLL